MEETIIQILFLTWLHYLADYPLQGEFLAQCKGKYDYLLLCYAIIWAGTICVGLHFIGILTLWKIVFLLIGHFFIDRWKARKDNKTNALTKDLWIDQALHFVQILIVYFI